MPGRLRAAQSSGKTRTDFILGAARRAAEEALLDQSLFLVSQSTYAKFLTARRPRQTQRPFEADDESHACLVPALNATPQD
jgi:uncharacterized protein (DUF1778 family)